MKAGEAKELIEIFKKLPDYKKYALYQFASFLDNSSLDSDILFQKTLEYIRLNRTRSITNSKKIEQLIEEMEAVNEL
jgi:hypothetical protein